MTTIRHLVSAAAIVAGLQLSPAVAQTQTAPPSADVVYHAPSWWISAVVQGRQSTLLTGNSDIDRRMNAWLVGFGYGLGDRCAPAEGRALQATLERHVANQPAMRGSGEKGTSDGRRFAEINGCSSTDAVAARRTVASIGGSLVVADATDRRDAEHRDGDRREERRDTERRDTERPNLDRRDVASAREAIVVNRSGARIDVLRMSAASDNDWGADRLGRDVLDSGQGVRVPLQGAQSCHYDLHVVYADTRFEERMNVNLCTDAQVVFDGSGARLPRQAANEQARFAGNGSSSR